MIRTVITLLTHALAVAFKNKPLYLIVCIPLFVYATLTLVDPADARVAKAKIALLRTESYAPAVVDNILWAPDQTQRVACAACGSLFDAQEGRFCHAAC